MATNLRKLCTQIHRLSPFARSLIVRTSVTYYPLPSYFDNLVSLSAIDPDGNKHEVIVSSGETLLSALNLYDLIDSDSHRLEDVKACSAECEVQIAEEWLEKLPPRSYHEERVLKRTSRSRVLNKHSRLGCQVVLTKELKGMVVAVPEAKPWDIP